MLVCILGILNLAGCGNKESPAEDFEYTCEGDYTIITGYDGNDTDIVFPSEINGVSVEIIDISTLTLVSNNPKFEKIKNVSVPDSVTDISDSFAGLEKLTHVKLGSGIIELDDYAFGDCTSLKVIELSEGLTIIGNNAFSGDKRLKSIDIPDSVSLIGNYTFGNCSSLESINIGSGFNQRGNDVFSGTKSLTSINVDKDNKTYCSVDGVYILRIWLD